jgi:DMSO/TMAO reductase YedYZ molybdopterin-dependent catalytic subunit
MSAVSINVLVLKSVLVGAWFFVRVASAEIAAPQADKANAPAVAGARLDVIDEAGAEHKMNRSDFVRLPRRSAKVKIHEAEAEFEGVPLVDLLTSAGVKFGDDLKGRRAATVAILEATDKYRVVVSLLEIDPQVVDRTVLVADKRGGQLLDAHEGPYRLIIPGDKREIRWIRNLRTIRVVNLIDLALRAESKPNADGTQR